MVGSIGYRIGIRTTDSWDEMLIVPRTESSIEFLVSRRFPFAHITPGRAISLQRLPDDKRDLLEIDAYERELQS